MAFREADLEIAIKDLLVQEGYDYVPGERIVRSEGEVLIEQDLRDYLHRRYDSEGITENEIRSIVLQLRSPPSSGQNVRFQLIKSGRKGDIHVQKKYRYNPQRFIS